jgi:hypothetical protein
MPVARNVVVGDFQPEKALEDEKFEEQIEVKR